MSTYLKLLIASSFKKLRFFNQKLEEDKEVIEEQEMTGYLSWKVFALAK